uniref:tRNA-splicing endonuclease subunit Sen2 n=1 Tax=Takifugu rubripes TaxID=31033 RepID=H2SBI7_TAKRU
AMQADFRPPKRRNRIQEEYGGALPVGRPGESGGPGESGELRAELINQHVLVCHPEHIKKIHNQGYLGKGVLSRARPEHSISERWEGLNVTPLLSPLSRYKDLLDWVEAILSAQGLDQQAVRRALLRLSEPVKMENIRPETGGEDRAGGSEMELERTGCSSLGCLCVYLDQEPLSILQLWRNFCSLRTDFISLFAAYQHFRSKGWIPKGGSGAKYGVDFLLYRKGPPFYHASYSVVVERVHNSYSGPGMRLFSWRSLAALSRITANVSKELMLCYIIYPDDLSDDELRSPECLSRLKVQEIIVSRWVSSRERVEHDDV